MGLMLIRISCLEIGQSLLQLRHTFFFGSRGTILRIQNSRLCHSDELKHKVVIQIASGKGIHFLHRHGCQILIGILHHIVAQGEKVGTCLCKGVFHKGMNLFQDTGSVTGLHLFH